MDAARNRTATGEWAARAGFWQAQPPVPSPHSHAAPAALVLIALFSCCFVGGFVGCSSAPTVPGSADARPITRDEIAGLISARVSGRDSWAQAVEDALRANQLPVTAPNACAVLALIAQESGFQEDPAVPGLAKLVAGRLERYEAKLGPLGGPILRHLLGARAPANPRTFQERLANVRTERDLDLVFRDLVTYYQSSYPATFQAASFAGRLFDGRDLAELNPITTAGPMQVSVRFAESWAREHHGDPARVRDALYTRAGGVYYGTARLFAGRAPYPRMIFLFADYNAGLFASRNAALQAELIRLTGKKLTLDGDFLSYGKAGEPSDDETQTMSALRSFRDRHAPDLSDRQLDRDARKEKSPDFENTATYRALKAAAAQTGKPPAYAVLPQLVLDSPKLSRKRSTAWFAEAVDRRYQACLAAAGSKEVVAQR
jgi:hypothetical protein